MLPFVASLMSASAQRGPAGLTLDFAAGAYSNGEVSGASPAVLSGYAFTRSGEQGAVSSAGLVQWFAAHVPAINDRGYHAYGALTNRLLQSQDFTTAWGTQPWVNRTANAGVAPDGATTADRLETSGNGSPGSSIAQNATVTSGVAHTASIWVKSNTASSYTLRLRSSWIGTQDQVVTVTPIWQRVVVLRTTDGTSEEVRFGSITGGDSPNFDILVWQGQLLDGSFADGGPIIRTGAATASIGASALTLGLGNGTYGATYNFDDNSTQNSPALTVSDGLLRHPVVGALTRGIVRKTVVAAA